MPSPKKVETSKAVIEEIRDLKQQQLNTIAIGEGTKESVLASETRESEETRSELLRTEGESIQSEAFAGGEARAEEGSGAQELAKSLAEVEKQDNKVDSVVLVG